MHRLALPAALVAMLAASAPAGAQTLLDGFDAYAARAVREWRVPGLAIAVVKDDSVVFAKGYGVRTLGRREPVDVHTLFANASTTKAFTATALLMLVDAGQLRLDDHATTYLPTLALRDPYPTRELTIRDLLTHRTGLPEDGLLWYGRSFDLPEIERRLRFLDPETSFRSHFAYENVTYAAVGEVAAAVAGVPWERLVHQRILDPLGMRETVTNTSAAASSSDVASPHAVLDDTVRVITRYDADNIAPAGAMYSSVADMARWMIFLLDSGRAGEQRLLSASAIDAMLSPQMLVGADEFYPTAQRTRPHFTAYGLGWFLEDYRGEYVVFHTGSIDGFSAIVGLIPERHLGVVVFANLDHAELRHALLYTVFDRYIGGGAAHDWSAELLAMYDSLRVRGRAAEQALDRSRVKGTKPSLPLDDYAGTYTDSLAGPVIVRVEHGVLALEVSPRLSAELEPWHYDTFMAHWRNRWLGRQLVSFRIGTNGAVRALDLGDGTVLTRVP